MKGSGSDLEEQKRVQNGLERRMSERARGTKNIRKEQERN